MCYKYSNVEETTYLQPSLEDAASTRKSLFDLDPVRLV